MGKGRSLIRVAGPFFCLLLAACGSSTAPTDEESRRLDNAEGLLNTAPDELSNIDASELEADEQSAANQP